MTTIPCIASGTVANVLLTPPYPVSSLKGVRVRWRHPFSGNIGTGLVPGAPITVQLQGFSAYDVTGPDGHTKCGVLDFHEGGFAAAEFVSELNAGFGGWLLTSPVETLTQSKWSHGECRFVAASANTVNLEGYNGYGLTVQSRRGGWLKRNVGGGLVQRIDNNTAWIDGVPGQSLAPDTLYYAYATEHPGDPDRLVHDFSETGHGTDPNLGIQVKAGVGGDFYTYVGMVYTKSGVVGPFTGDNGLTLCASWFNRQPLCTQLDFSASGITETADDVPLTADRLCILTHADSVPVFHASGYAAHTTGGRGGMRLRTDFVAVPDFPGGGTQYGSEMRGTSPSAGDPFGLHSVWGQPIPEGYIEVSPAGWVDSGAADFNLRVHAQIWL